MRFDKVIELIVVSPIEDGLGGRSQGEKVISRLNAHVDELPLEATIKVYGDAYVNNIRAIALGQVKAEADKIKYKENYYKIVNKSFVKNKTVYFLELVKDE